MRLIWKKYDSNFDPVVTVVGLGFVGGGAYGLALLVVALRDPFAWLIAAIPLLMGIMGVLILVREYQLWKLR
jgi:hypothetical protein